jgi:hypothetical protein
MEKQDVKQVMFQNGAVWAISTYAWQGTDRLNAADLNKTEEDIPDIFRLGQKYLIPEETRIQLLGFRTKVQAFMKKVGVPFITRGHWFVPEKNFIPTKQGLEAINSAMGGKVEEILTDLPYIKAKMIEEYPVLAEANWPTPEQIRTRFKIKYVTFEITSVGLGKPTDPQEMVEARAEFRSNLDSAFDELKNNILSEAHAAIIDVCEDISKKILSAGDAITETTLKKPRAVIDEYMKVAELFDLDSIKVKVSELKDLVSNRSAKSLRMDWEVRKEFGESMKKMGETIGNLSGVSLDGRVKRTIDLGNE